MNLEEQLHDLRARQEKVRPAGTPSTVTYPLGEISLPGHVDHWAQQRPDHPAVVFESATLTYAELGNLSRRLAGWLAAADVTPGDRVAVFLPNCPQFIVAMLAVLRVGAVHVPVNPMFQSAELEYELEDSGATVLVTSDALLPVWQEVRERTPVRTVLLTQAAQMSGVAAQPRLPADRMVTGWVEALGHDPAPHRSADLDALAALNYTGGTTGLPKGCQHTQRHMLYTAATSAAATQQGVDTDYVALCYIPIFWIAGEDLGILNPLVLGGTSLLMPRWDPVKVLDAIEQHRATTMVGTVENYLELLDQPGFADRDLSSLIDPMAVSFVRKLTPDVRHAWTAAAGPHSVLREGAYGMTETHTFDATPYGMAEEDADLLAEPVFCGVPMPDTDIAIVSFDTTEPVPIGESGEIIVRSPSVTSGYWNKPDATAAQLRNGWLHTGDQGRLNENGCLHYLGRRKDMIKVKGMSVFPAEVEMLLTRHPDVRTAAVVAAEDSTTGQRPVAFVSLNPGAGMNPEDLREWARGHMATYKVPLITVVEEFPMTTTGKIRKVELAELAQKLTNPG